MPDAVAIRHRVRLLIESQPRPARRAAWRAVEAYVSLRFRERDDRHAAALDRDAAAVVDLLTTADPLGRGLRRCDVCSTLGLSYRAADAALARALLTGAVVRVADGQSRHTRRRWRLATLPPVTQRYATAVRSLLRSGPMTAAEISSRLGVGRATVSRIMRGNTVDAAGAGGWAYFEAGVWRLTYAAGGR